VKLLKAEAEVPEPPVKLKGIIISKARRCGNVAEMSKHFMIHDTVIYPYHGDPEPFVITAITERYFELTPVRYKTWNGLKLQKIQVIKEASKSMCLMGNAHCKI
jgi:hypothetical protein